MITDKDIHSLLRERALMLSTPVWDTRTVDAVVHHLLKHDLIASKDIAEARIAQIHATYTRKR